MHSRAWWRRWPRPGSIPMVARLLQPLDQPEHRWGFGGLRHLPQPGEPRQAALFPALGQRVEALALFGGQPVSQPPMCFSPCLGGGVQRLAVQARPGDGTDILRCSARPHQTSSPSRRADRSRLPGVASAFHQVSRSMSTERAQPVAPGTRSRAAAGSARSRDIRRSTLEEHRPAPQRTPARAVGGRSPASQCAARETQVAAHQRLAEAVVIAAAARLAARSASDSV